MTKSKMILSLVALIGASLVFVVATFAWLTVTNENSLANLIHHFNDAETVSILEYSTDGVTYSPISSISIDNAVPGDVLYYRVAIENVGNVDLLTSVFLWGFTDSPADPLGDTTNYTNGQTLRDVLLIDSTNSATAETIVSTSMTTLIGTLPPGVDFDQALFGVAHNIPIAASETEYVYFTITVDPDAGNDYQNLNLDISQIQVSSVG